jgi:hypothetical protein
LVKSVLCRSFQSTCGACFQLDGARGGKICDVVAIRRESLAAIFVSSPAPHVFDGSCPFRTGNAPMVTHMFCNACQPVKKKFRPVFHLPTKRPRCHFEYFGRTSISRVRCCTTCLVMSMFLACYGPRVRLLKGPKIGRRGGRPCSVERLRSSQHPPAGGAGRALISFRHQWLFLDEKGKFLAL